MCERGDKQMSLGLRSFLMVGLMAIIFIILAKVVINKYVPADNAINKLVNTV